MKQALIRCLLSVVCGISLSGMCGCISYPLLDRQVQVAVADSVRPHEGVSTNVMSDAIAAPAAARSADEQLALDLDIALRLASEYSRILQDKRDTLYRSGLSLLKQRRSFGVELASTVSYVFHSASDDEDSSTSQMEVSADRILPTGAKISVSGSTAAENSSSTNGNSTTYGSSLTVELEQPLLAGAGYAVSHEDLIQAERDLLYALRAFALERQDFAIEIARQYYDLLISRQVLDNISLNVKQSTALTRRSEALFKVSRVPAIDVMRAQQQELSAKNRLLQTKAEFDVELKRFIIKLGLPITTGVTVTGTVPELRPLIADEQSCTRTAIERRLDLMTVRGQCEDAKRKLRAKLSYLLPELDVFGKAGLSSEGAGSLGGQDFEDELSAGVNLRVPLDRRNERDAVKAARLDVTAAARALAGKEDEVRLEIIGSFRKLKSLADIVKIERTNIGIAERRARNAFLRFKNGELLNRDVVEAENELLDARNAYVRSLVNHEMERVRLMRNIGTADVTAQGRIVELTLEPHTRKADGGSM